MIDQDRFVKRDEPFKPSDTFKLIFGIFKKQSEMMNAPIIFETVKQLYSPELVQATDEYLDNELDSLPQTLIGDHLRLKQVLVNLIKNALKFSYGKPVRVKTSYDGNE